MYSQALVEAAFDKPVGGLKFPTKYTHIFTGARPGYQTHGMVHWFIWGSHQKMHNTAYILKKNLHAIIELLEVCFRHGLSFQHLMFQRYLDRTTSL